MKIVDQVISSLESGDWQSFEELKRHCSLPEYQIKTVLSFLTGFDFLENNHADFSSNPKIRILIEVG